MDTPITNINPDPVSDPAPNLDHEGSFESLTAGITYEDPRFHLQLTQRKEYKSERPLIRATRGERLNFYRAQATSTSKTDIIMVQTLDVNSFLWFYMCNLIFKSLPHSFLHFFLAAYAPEQHMFVDKMVPISYGIIYLFIMTGFLEICTTLDLILMLCTYAIQGPLYKNPWNRCSERVYFDSLLNSTIHCYEYREFAKKFINTTNITYLEYTYMHNNEQFELAQIAYYRTYVTQNKLSNEIIIMLIVWGIIQVLQHYVCEKLFWKVLHCSHWALNSLGLLVFIDLLINFYIIDESIPIAQIPKSEEADSKFWSTDLDLLGESITAPNIVHVLTSRSRDDIDPTTDSAVMVASNAILYIFEGLLSIKMKLHVERLCNTEIPVPIFNQHAWFYMWPLYFSTYYLGDVFSVIFFTLNFIEEIYIVIINYFCFLETVIYEWPKIKRWMVLIVVTIGVVIVHFYTDIDSRFVLWVYGKSLATLAECIFVYIMYPLGRLIDDFTFHFGVTPTQLRILSLRLVPIYYLVKVYIMIESLWSVLEVGDLVEWVPHYKWSWVVFLLPLLFGGMYIVYKYLVTYRMTWTYIFRPIPKWGPRDFSVRQLRKQYDSRYYIGSEVPRLLSRFLLSKRESKVFKVDVRYDMYRRSTTTSRRSTLRFKEEKKEK